jgi:2-dehydropantoate 2-reductase
MPVGILGSGALGCVYGGSLHEAGEEVRLIDTWAEHVEGINRDGLIMEREQDRQVVHPEATTAPETLGTLDVLFVLVKATQTRQALDDVSGAIDEETTVVTVQNGLKNVDIIGEQVPEAQIVSGSTMIGATVTAPGTVRLHQHGETVLGGQQSNRVQEVVTMLERTPLAVSAIDDPRETIWSKQLVNVSIKPIGALTELPNGEIAASEHLLGIMDKLLSETMSVAAAAGISLDETEPLDHIVKVCERTSEKHTSMLVDIEQERETEIDQINGAVAEYGARHDVPTPYNDLVTALVHGKEASYLD